MNTYESKIVEMVMLASSTGDYTPVESILVEISKLIAEWKEPDMSDPETYKNFFGDLTLRDAYKQNKYWRYGGWAASIWTHGCDAIGVNLYLDDARYKEGMTSRSLLMELEIRLKNLLKAVEGDTTPTWDHAIWSGIKDTSYKSARQGEIGNYSGSCTIKTPHRKWSVEGTRSKGTAYAVSSHGKIVFTPH
jgi:hypothetical protein